MNQLLEIRLNCNIAYKFYNNYKYNEYLQEFDR